MPIISQSFIFSCIGASMYLHPSIAKNLSRDNCGSPSACPVNVVLSNASMMLASARNANMLRLIDSVWLFISIVLVFLVLL